MSNPVEELRRHAADYVVRYRVGVELLIWLGKGIPTMPAAPGERRVDVEELRYMSGAWSGGERRVVAVALSLMVGDPVDLDDVIGGLGGAHRRAVVDAIAAAAGLRVAA